MTNANGWDSVVREEENNGGGFNPENKIDFLTLAEGDTLVRILDAVPHRYNEWWAVKGDGGGKNGKGCRIPYHGAGKDLLEKANQEFMNKKFKEADAKGLKDKARKDFLRDHGYSKTPFGKLKTKYIIHVLDVAAGEIKLLDGTGGIFENIKKIAARKGDPREYDLVINREGTGFQDTEYTVMYEGGDKEIPADVLEKYNEVKVDLVKLKGADFCTPEQALAVAKGAKWEDILERSSSDSEESDSSTGHTEDTPAQEEKPARKDEPVKIDKSEELSEDDLNEIDFE